MKMMINRILKAIGVGAGIATTVLTIMKAVEEKEALKLLGLGLSCIAISNLSDDI